MSAINQCFAKPLDVSEEVGPVLEDGQGFMRAFDDVEEFGILHHELQDGIPEILFFRLDLLDGVLGCHLPATDAEILLAGRLLPASRTLD